MAPQSILVNENSSVTAEKSTFIIKRERNYEKLLKNVNEKRALISI